MRRAVDFSEGYWEPRMSTHYAGVESSHEALLKFSVGADLDTVTQAQHPISQCVRGLESGARDNS
jgi:hypothetical protein